METIELYNRYPENTVKLVPLDESSYMLECENVQYFSVTHKQDNDSYLSVDPEGGPMLIVNGNIPGTDKCITSITYNNELKKIIIKV